MLKGFLGGLGVMVLIVGAVLIYRSYNVYCPCGFKYDGITGGCVVDFNAGPCTDQGGGNSPGSSSSGSGRATAGSSDFPAGCGLYVSSCSIRSDWKAAQFTLVNFGGTVSTGAPLKEPVALAIVVRDKGGGSCVQIKGTIDVPLDTPMTIPFDASALAGSFPIATSSTSGTPSTGLLADIRDGCPGELARIVAFPTQYDAETCGCKVPFKRGQ